MCTVATLTGYQVFLMVCTVGSLASAGLFGDAVAATFANVMCHEKEWKRCTQSKRCVSACKAGLSLCILLA